MKTKDGKLYREIINNFIVTKKNRGHQQLQFTPFFKVLKNIKFLKDVIRILSVLEKIDNFNITSNVLLDISPYIKYIRNVKNIFKKLDLEIISKICNNQNLWSDELNEHFYFQSLRHNSCLKQFKCDDYKDIMENAVILHFCNDIYQNKYNEKTKLVSFILFIL
jgi:hypothetical protein